MEGGHCKDRNRVRSAQGMASLGPLPQPSHPLVPLGNWESELGVHVWFCSAPDLPRDLKMDTIVAGLCAFKVCD